MPEEYGPLGPPPDPGPEVHIQVPPPADPPPSHKPGGGPVLLPIVDDAELDTGSLHRYENPMLK